MKQFSKLVLALSLSVSAGAAFSAPATLGALFTFTGTGASAGMSGSIYDKDIHSGVFRDVNAPPSGLSGPLGTLSDSYVLQGGDPFGGDTQDNFEVSQASGHAVVSTFFDVFTHYDYSSGAFPPGLFPDSSCSMQVGTCIIAGPDSGWVTFVNNSGGVWTGDVSLTGQAFGGIYGPAQFFANSATGLSIANGGSASCWVRSSPRCNSPRPSSWASWRCFCARRRPRMSAAWPGMWMRGGRRSSSGQSQPLETAKKRPRALFYAKADTPIRRRQRPCGAESCCPPSPTAPSRSTRPSQAREARPGGCSRRSYCSRN